MSIKPKLKNINYRKLLLLITILAIFTGLGFYFGWRGGYNSALSGDNSLGCENLAGAEALARGCPQCANSISC